MNRKEALEILKLSEEATPDGIIKRVDMLYRKFKNGAKNVDGHTLEDVENAYKTLIGITYRDVNDEQKINYRKEHPNFFFKLLKLDEEKARNFIYYHKWHAVISLAIIALIVSALVTIFNRVEPDLKVMITGEIYLSDTTPLEMRIESEIPYVTEVLVQNVYLSESSDPQTAMAMQTKFTVEIAAGNNDIFILDEETYLKLAKQGAFKPIRDILNELGTLTVENSDLKRLEVALEIDDGKTYSPELYGLDVSDSEILRNSGVIGKRLIVALGNSGVETKNAAALIKIMLD